MNGDNSGEENDEKLRRQTRSLRAPVAIATAVMRRSTEERGALPSGRGVGAGKTSWKRGHLS